MNKSKIVSFLALMCISTSILLGQNRIQKDLYGREILDNSGKKINYSRTDIVPDAEKVETQKARLKSSSDQSSNCKKDTINTRVENLYTIIGTSIGRNSMHSIDIDNDGIVELICTASTGGFGLADYWYMLHYNSKDSTCNQVWTSQQFSTKITSLEVIDPNNDAHYQIILTFEDGTIQMFDGKTKTLLKQIRPVSEKINSLVYADADNDGKNDFVIACEYNTYVLDQNTFLQKNKIAQGANYVRVGNVNQDSNNEIVLSKGLVYQISNSEVKTLWKFSSAYDGILELSDIDSDSMLEIIFAESWQKIDVYDADTQTTKYVITTDQDINTLYLKDVNNDGIDEILYGDGQWGKVFCYNSVTQSKMWSVNNPEHGVAAINFSDLNNDGKQELIWTAGWTSTGSDYLYIYDVPNSKLLWRSADVVGPFYAIAKGDVDGDGKDEIVAISNESESGYESGILFIFDANTNQLKWNSNGRFFLNVWTGIYNVCIKDVDEDGKNEIIVAAGQTYTGEIWIVDGKTHSIKSSHIFSSENISEFYGLNVDDVDNDGKFEVVACSNGKLYVINPQDWAIKWIVVISSYYAKSIIKCTDLNGDGKKEIILCKGYIQIIDGANHSIWTSSESDFINFDLFDVNNDGIQDIIASTSTGHIITMNGKTKASVNNLNPENSEIVSVKLRKLGNSFIYIYSCNGRINFYKNDSTCKVTQNLGTKIGEVESMKMFDDKADTSAILVGTPISVLKLSGRLALCLDFNIHSIISEVSCTKEDGVIKLNVTGGTKPYGYLWSNNSKLDSLGNLSPGQYWVKVNDGSVCSGQRYFNLPRATIAASLQVTSQGCKVLGTAHLSINHINPPYSISWSNSQKSQDITNLVAGKYNVTITDAKNCKFEGIASVEKDTIIISTALKHVSCNGYSDGYISLFKLSGADPLRYNWNTGGKDNSIEDLKAGIYTVTVSDTLGCENRFNFKLTEPEKIKYTVLVSPDDLKTSVWEGKIMINDINGGTSPYQVYWPRFSKYTDYMEVLPTGKYAFVVSDANNCFVRDTVFLNSISTGIQELNADEFSIFPNPVGKTLTINNIGKEYSCFDFELMNSNGQVIISKQKIYSKQSEIDFSTLNPGVYILRFHLNQSVFYKKIIKE